VHAVLSERLRAQLLAIARRLRVAALASVFETWNVDTPRPRRRLHPERV